MDLKKVNKTSVEGKQEHLLKIYSEHNSEMFVLERRIIQTLKNREMLHIFAQTVFPTTHKQHF